MVSFRCRNAGRCLNSGAAIKWGRIMTVRNISLSFAAAACVLGTSTPAVAQENYIGEVLMVGFSYCPRGTTEAAGQIIAIASNTALFSLYGTTFGGNGQTTFGLPDLQGRSAVGQGNGAGLSPVQTGEKAGLEAVTLTVGQMPAHSHTGHVRATTEMTTTDNPTNATLGDFPDGQQIYAEHAPDVDMAPNTVQTDMTGGSQPVPIRNPYLGMRYCVVLEGIFPPRN
jgi:microcystin-dependent protein